MAAAALLLAPSPMMTTMTTTTTAIPDTLPGISSGRTLQSLQLTIKAFRKAAHVFSFAQKLKNAVANKYRPMTSMPSDNDSGRDAKALQGRARSASILETGSSQSRGNDLNKKCGVITLEFLYSDAVNQALKKYSEHIKSGKDEKDFQFGHNEVAIEKLPEIYEDMLLMQRLNANRTYVTDSEMYYRGGRRRSIMANRQSRQSWRPGDSWAQSRLRDSSGIFYRLDKSRRSSFMQGGQNRQGLGAVSRAGSKAESRPRDLLDGYYRSDRYANKRHSKIQSGSESRNALGMDPRERGSIDVYYRDRGDSFGSRRHNQVPNGQPRQTWGTESRTGARAGSQSDSANLR